jgi:hypothetical protein
MLRCVCRTRFDRRTTVGECSVSLRLREDLSDNEGEAILDLFFP